MSHRWSAAVAVCVAIQDFSHAPPIPASPPNGFVCHKVLHLLIFALLHSYSQKNFPSFFFFLFFDLCLLLLFDPLLSFSFHFTFLPSWGVSLPVSVSLFFHYVSPSGHFSLRFGVFWDFSWYKFVWSKLHWTSHCSTLCISRTREALQGFCYSSWKQKLFWTGFPVTS